MDLFGYEETKKHGGKRENAGRPKIQEKRRIILLEKIAKEFIEQEKAFMNLPPKKQGAHRESVKFAIKIAPLIPQ